VSLQRYRVLRLLRRGGMGILYEAWDTKLDRTVALKVVAHPLDPDACRRAVLEAKAVTRVRSDHVVQVYDAGEAKAYGSPYLVMELLDGEDLQAVIQRGPVPSSTAVDWILQACEALAHLNLHGLVHRDVKPANLFLEARIDGSARLKLLDFGVAKDINAGLRTSPTSDGEVIGSLPYMAPEQVLDSRDVDLRADVWGLGVVLYELLAGHPAFAAKTRLDALAMITLAPHTPLFRLPLCVPDGLSDVVDRCLEKQRERRYASIAELARALEPFASPSGLALVPRIVAVAAAKLPPAHAPAVQELGPRRAVAALDGDADEAGDDPDAGLDLGALGERAGFTATVASHRGAAPDRAGPSSGWGSRTLRALRRAGVVGPLAAAAAVALVAAWPRVASLSARRYERLSSASHCLASFIDYPAVEMTHQVGNPRGDYWNLYTNGWVSQSHAFATGEAEVRVSAAADFAGDELPHMVVSVDAVVIGEVDVASEDFADFRFPYAARAGIHVVRVHFSNDYLQGGKDRNLILGQLAVGQCSGEEP
jgi:eukaryotic-like serine/threonine-protein kinase